MTNYGRLLVIRDVMWSAGIAGKIEGTQSKLLLLDVLMPLKATARNGKVIALDFPIKISGQPCSLFE